MMLALLQPVFSSDLSASVGNPGFIFIENKGQWSSDVLFMTEIPGGRLFIKRNGLHYRLVDQGHYHHNDHGDEHTQKEAEDVEVEFINANSTNSWDAVEMVGTTFNYYLGKDPKFWGEGCRGFRQVQLHDLYDGVDLKFYQEAGQLKYDFIVQPGTDYQNIAWQYKADRQVEQDGGCVGIRSSLVSIFEGQPISYQRTESDLQYLESHYKLEGERVSFEIPASINQDVPLVIDPALIFSTFSGSISDNWGYTACFDEASNFYSGGIVFGDNFPSTTGQPYGGGLFDISILKYDSTGSDLIYATYLGGSGSDTPQSLVVDDNNELVMLGTTGSRNFPMSAGAFDNSFNGGRPFRISTAELYPEGSDIFLAKLDESGQLLRSTYMGGPGNDGVLRMRAINFYDNALIQNYGDYQRGDVITDKAGNVYVASNTDSTGFPTTSGLQTEYAGGASDAVVFSLSSDLSTLRYSTYIGGEGDDAMYSIKLDSADRVLVGGGTSSEAIFPPSKGGLSPGYGGNIDGIIALLDMEYDSLLYFTYLGTPAYDQAYFIDIDAEQNVYALGQTRGNYPITPGSFAVPNSSQFIHKLSPDLGTTIFSTVFGSGETEPNISPTAFLANECENIFLSGWGGEINQLNSANNGATFGMPVTDDALYPNTDGSDFYLMALSADGRELLYATFFGGTAGPNDSEDHVDGGTSRFDKRGIIYQSVCSCGGDDDTFPVTDGAYSIFNRGTVNDTIPRCNNAAFKFDLASLRARFTTNTPEEDLPGLDRGCAPFTVLLTNKSIGGEEFFWEVSDGATSEAADSWVHTFESPGTYTVKLTIRDENTCTGVDSTMQQILVFDDAIAVSPDVTICRGESIQLNATGGVQYEWSPSGSLSDASASNPVASPLLDTEYIVRITTENGCVNKDTVRVDVESVVREAFAVTRSNDDCQSVPVFTFENLTPNTPVVAWDFGDGTGSTEESPTHQFAADGNYVVSLETEGDCIIDEEISIIYEQLFVPNAFSPNGDGKNDFFEIKTDQQVSLSVFDRSGKLLVEEVDYTNNWAGTDLSTGTYFYQITLEDGTTCDGWVQLLR